MNVQELQVTTTELMGEKLNKLSSGALVATVIGAVLCALTFFTEQKSFYHSYLFAWVFWAGISCGSMALLLLHHTVGGGWGFVIRRFIEAGASLIPLAALLSAPVIAGLFLGNLYAWYQPHPGHELSGFKADWFATPFFLARWLAYFGIWWGFSTAAIRLGRRFNTGADKSTLDQVNRLGGFGILIYVITVTFASVDWVMSLTPHWTSSIFGLLFVASQALSTMALMLFLVWQLAGDSPLVKGLGRYFRDLGNFTLAMVMLWAYMSFSQYLITYSGNTVEELTWYQFRSTGSWRWVAVSLIAFHFAAPFLLLLTNSGMKRSPSRLGALAVLILLMRFIDLWWLVKPTFSEQVTLNWSDLGAPLLIGGIWLFSWARAMRDQPIVPFHDPRLQAHLHEVVSHA